ncbi:hypothetical protein CVT24_009972 [Panaeolus cyanescens]|uniref:Uncharacterized protein n=1 Tax=Panaeolus cyanescens TaxID=181874 RepID=A0A409W436_9AGAR|nr:hypothetical protein CVT24_009972 [Panaeolus cyanescens]
MSGASEANSVTDLPASFRAMVFTSAILHDASHDELIRSANPIYLALWTRTHTAEARYEELLLRCSCRQAAHQTRTSLKTGSRDSGEIVPDSQPKSPLLLPLDNNEDLLSLAANMALPKNRPPYHNPAIVAKVRKIFNDAENEPSN